MKKQKKKSNKFIYRVLPLLLIPGLCVLTVVSTHSNELIFEPINYFIYILLSLFIYLLVVGLWRVKKGRRLKKAFRILSVLFILGYTLGCTAFLILLYGPNDRFRNWLISSAMRTMNHQYLCKWFYSEEEIQKVLKNNYIVEVDEDTDTDLIKHTIKETFDNEFEEAILKGHDEDEKYRIIDLTVNGQKAYLAAIYDPSKVRVAVTKYIGSKGQYVTEMAQDHDAILAINGGGFVDPGHNSTGGLPTSVTLSFGTVKTDNTYGSYTQAGGLIGLTNDNKLIFVKNPTGQKALEQGVRDAISWGPFLIVNRKKSFIKGNGGWGYAARTAIGQREDGIVLFLTVDSNATRTKGADMDDLTEIMYNYGAVNAANLDGGTSTVMVLPKKQALNYISSCEEEYCYINDPINGNLKHRTRAIATSIIVTK